MEIKEVDVIINILRAVKKLSSYGIGEFNVGDIVLDKVNNEYGIVLSIKPNPIYSEIFLKDLLKVNDRVEIAYYASNESRPNVDKTGTLVLLTLTESNGERVEKGTPDFRVRYTNTRNLKKINTFSDKILKTSTGVSDLENHCQNECFLDCSEECSLWKYKKGTKKG